jgi:hypothetical protein
METACSIFKRAKKLIVANSQFEGALMERSMGGTNVERL